MRGRRGGRGGGRAVCMRPLHLHVRLDPGDEKRHRHGQHRRNAGRAHAGWHRRRGGNGRGAQVARTRRPLRCACALRAARRPARRGGTRGRREHGRRGHAGLVFRVLRPRVSGRQFHLAAVGPRSGQREGRVRRREPRHGRFERRRAGAGARCGRRALHHCVLRRLPDERVRDHARGRATCAADGGKRGDRAGGRLGLHDARRKPRQCRFHRKAANRVPGAQRGERQAALHAFGGGFGQVRAGGDRF